MKFHFPTRIPTLLLSFTFGIVMVLAMTLLIIFQTQHKNNHTLLEQQCNVRAEAERSKMTEQIESQLIMAETLANNIALVASDLRYTLVSDSTETYATFQRLLEANPYISGILLQVCCPQGNNRYYTIQIRKGTDNQYFHSAVETIHQHRHKNITLNDLQFHDGGYWTSPFYSEDSVVITSYLTPIFEGPMEAKKIGALAVDVDLCRFAKQIERERQIPGSLVAIIDEDLKFIIHPDRNYMPSWDLPTAMRRIGINPDLYPLHHAHERQTGRCTIQKDEIEMFVYYGPIEHTRWTLLLYLPTSEVLEPLHILKTNMTLIGTAAIIFILLCGIGFTLHVRHSTQKQK